MFLNKKKSKTAEEVQRCIPNLLQTFGRKSWIKKLAISSFFATCRSSSISRMFLRDIETWTRIGPPKIPCQSTSCIIHFAKWKKNYLQNPLVGEHWKWKWKDGNLKEKVAKEREREKGGRRGGVTVNCVGVEAKRSSTLDLSALGCSALHRAVSKESTARQTLPPVKTFHKIFPRKTLSGIQHEWKLRYSYLQRRKLLCAHCWKDVFQA